MEIERNYDWLRLLNAQAGVVSRQQARDAGWPEKAIDRRLRSGTWQRLQRGAYATFSGIPSREARLWAAVLRAGPGAALSHQTAAEIHGLTDKRISKVHISVPATRNPSQIGPIWGVVIHRGRGLVAEWMPPWQLPRTSVEDTVLDLIAAARTFDDAYGGGLRYLDNLYEAYGLCVELDGAAAHPAEGRWRDTRRDNVNFVQGARTLRYGWPDVTEHRCRTAAEVGAILREQGWTGTVRCCGPACAAAAAAARAAAGSLKTGA